MAFTFEQIKARFDELANDPKPITPGYLGVTVGILDQFCGGAYYRHHLQRVLTGHDHVHELTEGQKYALTKMVSATKLEGGVTSVWEPENPERLSEIVKLILAQDKTLPVQEEIPF